MEGSLFASARSLPPPQPSEIGWGDRVMRLRWLIGQTRPWVWQSLAALMVLLAVHIGVDIILDHAREAALDAGFRRTEAMAVGIEAWLDRSLDGAEMALDRVQQRHDVIETTGKSSVALDDMLREMTNSHRFNIINIAELGEDGISRWNVLAGDTPIDMHDRPYVQQQMWGTGKTMVTDIMMGRAAHQPVFILSRRLRHLDGTFGGVASVSIDPRSLAQQLAKLFPRPQQRALIWRDGGSMLVNTAWADQEIAWPTYPAADDLIMLGASETANLRKASRVDSQEIMLTMRRLSRLGIVVAGAIESKEALGPTARLDQMAWFGQVFLAVLLFGGIVFDGQRRSRQRAMAALAAASLREKTAAATQAEINRVISNVPGMIYRCRYHLEGTIELFYISRSCESVIGWSPETLIEHPEILFAIESKTIYPFQADRLLPEQPNAEQWSRDWQVRRADGTLRWMRFSEQLMVSNDRYVEVVGVVSDIETERAATASAVAAGRLATLGEMATGIAHEMSQPLATMSVLVENALYSLRHAKTEAAISRLERLPNLAQRANTILDHLRLFGRRDTPASEVVGIDKIVDGAMLLAGGLLRDADVIVVVALPANPPKVAAGQVQMEQVLVNLLLNARDAMLMMPVGYRRVTISAREIDTEVELTISDTGPGLSEAVRARLFEPFFTTKAPGDGTGLGLSICHGIVQSYGGSIVGENTAEGARFAIRLHGWKA